MTRLLCSLFLLLALCACGSSASGTRNSRSSSYSKASSPTEQIIQYAVSFEGTRYRFGGTSKAGMDCSGLVYVSFKEADLELPRVSRDMAKQGRSVPLTKAQPGDLLFFSTSKKGRGINHVGLIVEREGGDIQFIHSTTSRGVIISSLDEKYWKNAFVQARKMI